MSSNDSKLEVKPEFKLDHHGVPLDNPSLQGLSRYFNNSTIRGRANVAKATFAAFFGFYLYKKLQKSESDANKTNESVEPNLEQPKNM